MVKRITIKESTLKESQAPYAVALNKVLLTAEPVILEQDGQSVAAVIPFAEYEAFQTWREAEQRRQARQAEEAAIEQEYAAYQKMLPELLEKYAGRVVALYQGEVVQVGDDEGDIWQQARERLGPVPIYVETVEHPPRVYSVPHRKVVR